MFPEETYRVLRATKSIEPILKKRDGLFALARILWFRQARPDNYWLLNSAPARRSQKSATMPGPLAAITALLRESRYHSRFVGHEINEIINKKKRDREDVCKNANEGNTL